MARMDHAVPKNGSKIFLRQGLDSRLSVESVRKFRFFAQVILLPQKAPASVATPAKCAWVHLSGKSPAPSFRGARKGWLASLASRKQQSKSVWRLATRCLRSQCAGAFVKVRLKDENTRWDGNVAEKETDAVASLCHYTNLAGLVGILESGQLWASNVAFLNDREELLHGIKCAKRALDQILKDHKLIEWRDAIKTVVNDIEDSQNP